MDLTSVNVDVLLYLMKFVDPVDRSNVVLSGILKGFENANEGIDLQKRIEGIGIELGPCRDSTCQLEVRSLEDRTFYYKVKKKSHLIALNRLVDRGFLKNNREMFVSLCRRSVPRLFRIIRSMTHLEKLSLLECQLTLTEDVPQLFRSCPTLTELHLRIVKSQKSRMNKVLKNQLRKGFERLRLLEIDWYIDSWPAILEIFTWLKECAQLTVRNSNVDWRTRVKDGSLTLNLDLSKKLRDLHLHAFPVEFVKWILPFCPNIDTLKLDLNEELNDLHNEIVRLKKLKQLHIGTCVGIDPNEIIRNCRQVEILRVDAYDIALQDLAELEHYENLKEAHLRWLRDPVKEVLPILKRCANLRRLSLMRLGRLPIPSPEEFCDFIMELKHLTFLHIIYSHHASHCNHFKSEVDEVKAFVLPRRPNFKFYISCCSKFDESRVPKEFF